MVTRHLADLLYHNECVIVPGLGGFIKASDPAKIIHATHQFFPPSAHIAFNAGLTGNDGILANHIALTEKINYTEALFEIRQWVATTTDLLNKGEKLVLPGIGDLFRNVSGNLEFTPDRRTNFNADSFGLPVFFAKAVVSGHYDSPEIVFTKQVVKESHFRKLVPETLKWAAVIAPFIAFALWGTLNGNIADNYIHNYTGMFSWVRSTPGKTVVIPPATDKTAEIPQVIINSPSEILAEQNISFNPNVVSYSELAKHNITINDTIQVVRSVSLPVEQNYHIIGGAFRDQTNALKLVELLRQQGYPAAIIDTTRSGLFIVSMKGFMNFDEASLQLDEIKKVGYSTSWILKKNKV
jgi:hypothetical protein